MWSRRICNSNLKINDNLLNIIQFNSQVDENPLRCTTQNKNDLIFIKVIFSIYFNPHQN